MSDIPTITDHIISDAEAKIIFRNNLPVNSAGFKYEPLGTKCEMKCPCCKQFCSCSIIQYEEYKNKRGAMSARNLCKCDKCNKNFKLRTKLKWLD